MTTYRYQGRAGWTPEAVAVHGTEDAARLADHAEWARANAALVAGVHAELGQQVELGRQILASVPIEDRCDECGYRLDALSHRVSEHARPRA